MKPVLIALFFLIGLFGSVSAHDININVDNSVHHHYQDNGNSGDFDGIYSPGSAVAAAAGTRVRDWTQGMQKCGSWAWVDSDDFEDGGVHALGGGVTFRVDKYSMSFYGGAENIGTGEATMLVTGSFNWR